MLTLTDNAVQAIRDLMVGEDLPHDAGMRIASVENDPGTLEISLTSGPETGDQVVTKSDAHVFVESGAARIVEDGTLDADLNDQGHPSFRLFRGGEQTE
jgi:Fe-S cluster assembly iron-binding protein IscA